MHRGIARLSWQAASAPACAQGGLLRGACARGLNCHTLSVRAAHSDATALRHDGLAGSRDAGRTASAMPLGKRPFLLFAERVRVR